MAIRVMVVGFDEAPPLALDDILRLATGIHKDAKELHVLIREVKPHVS